MEEGEYVPFYNIVQQAVGLEENTTYERVFHLREHSCSANNMVREIAGEGENDEQVLTSLGQVASLMHDQEKFQQVEPLYRRLLKVQERVLGIEDEGTLITVGNLASVLQDLGKLEEAEVLSRRDLEGCERVLGVDHPDTLTSVNNLGQLLHEYEQRLVV